MMLSSGEVPIEAALLKYTVESLKVKVNVALQLVGIAITLSRSVKSTQILLSQPFLVLIERQAVYFPAFAYTCEGSMRLPASMADVSPNIQLRAMILSPSGAAEFALLNFTVLPCTVNVNCALQFTGAGGVVTTLSRTTRLMQISFSQPFTVRKRTHMVYTPVSLNSFKGFTWLPSNEVPSLNFQMRCTILSPAKVLLCALLKRNFFVANFSELITAS